jgi:flagellar biosynthesis GTPase FlhF
MNFALKRNQRFSNGQSVSRIVSKFADKSLKDASSKKSRAKFDKLSSADKRSWRESLQRYISEARGSCVRAVERQSVRARSKGKNSSKDRARIEKMQRREATLWLDEDNSLEYQTGIRKLAVAGALVGASAVVASKVASASDATVAVTEKAGSLMDTITGLLQDFVAKVKEYGSIIWKVLLCALVYYLLVNYGRSLLLVSALLGAVKRIVPDMHDDIKAAAGATTELPNDDESETIELQSGVSCVSNLVAMFCTVFVPHCKSKGAIAGEFMKRVTMMPRASEGIECFMRKTIELFSQFLSFISFGTSEKWLPLDKKLDAYVAWKNRTIDMILELTKTASVPIDTIRAAKALQMEGIGFMQLLTTDDSKREMNYLMEKLNVKLHPHEGALAADSTVRATPYFLLLGGETGVGKTTVTRLAGTTILMLSGLAKAGDALENLWQKGTSDYWNGYIGQKCLVMDDCFQVKPKQGDNDSEAIQVIRAIGNWSCPLNFADLMSKGKFYLESPLVIGTTNCRNIKREWAPYITSPEALVRRFQGAYWMSVTPEFSKPDGTADFMKIEAAIHDGVARVGAAVEKGEALTLEWIMDQLPWHAWELRAHGYDSNEISETVFPGGLRRAIMLAADEIKLRREVNDRQVEDLRSWNSSIAAALNDLETQAGVKTYRLKDDDSLGFELKPLGASAPEPCADPEAAKLEEMRNRSEEHRGVLAFMMKAKEVLNSWKNKILELPLLQKCVVGLGPGIIATFTVPYLWKLVSPLVCGAVSFVGHIFAAFADLLGLRKRPVVGPYLPIVKVQSNAGTAHKGGVKHMELTHMCEKLESQLGVPPAERDVHDKVMNNSYLCTSEDETVGTFLGVGASVYLFPKHFLECFEGMNPDRILTFTSVASGTVSTISIASFLKYRISRVAGFDLAAISFNDSFLKVNKDIRKLFLTTQELKNLLRGSNTRVRLDVPRVDLLAKKNGRHRVKVATQLSPWCEYHGSSKTAEGDVLRGLVKYSATTLRGDCGTPLMVEEARYYGGRVIMGIHSAGRAEFMHREGYATTVPQEVVRELFATLASYEDNSVESAKVFVDVPADEKLELQTHLQNVGLVAGSFDLIGELKSPYNIATDTKLKASEMQTDAICGPCPTAPAVLKPVVVDDERKYPMVEGLRAFQTDLIARHPTELTAVADMAMQRHMDVTARHPRDILTFEEALTPPETWKLKPVNRSTSAGYKYRDYVSPKHPGKTWALGHEGPISWDSDGLRVVREDVEHILEEAKQGRRTLHLCIDFLKDELRPLAKVQAVATRVIAGVELDYLIACRMYFGAFQAACFDTHVVNGMAPGLNHYTEWSKLVDHLSSFDKVFDGDYKRFDASEQPWIHSVILAYINRWYKLANDTWKSEDDVVRSVLWLDLVHSRHICGTSSSLRYVIQWNKSLPSGHPLTTIVNSMYSLITLAGCYVHTVGDFDFNEHVRVNTFGDDNISSVSDEVCDRFNQVTVAAVMSDLYGLTYTAGHKDSELVPYTDLSQCTFLKRGFAPDLDGLVQGSPCLEWIGPLDEGSFLYEGYWFKNTRHPYEDLAVRVEHTLCELSLHEQSKWDMLAPPIIQWCISHGVKCLKSRDLARARIKTRTDVWF